MMSIDSDRFASVFLLLLAGEAVSGLLKSVDNAPSETFLEGGGDDWDPVENLYEDLCGIGMTACNPVSNTGLPSEPIIERPGNQGFDDELEPISDSNEYPPL